MLSLSWQESECFHFLTRCLNACTYCKTKHARGDLASYPIEELVDRAKQSFQGKSFYPYNRSQSLKSTSSYFHLIQYGFIMVLVFLICCGCVQGCLCNRKPFCLGWVQLSRTVFHLDFRIAQVRFVQAFCYSDGRSVMYGHFALFPLS